MLRQVKNGKSNMGKRKKLLCVLGIVFTCMCTISVPVSVLASKSTKEQIEEKEKEKEQTQKELEQTQNDLEDLRGTHGELKSELSNLNRDLEEVSMNLAELEMDISEKEAEIEQTELELQAAIDREDAQYESMKSRIKFMYECGDTLYFDMLFGAQSFGDFLNKADYIEQLSQYDRQMLEEYTKSRTDTEERRSELYQEQTELQAYKDEVEEQKASVENKVAKTSNNIKNYADQITDAEAEALEYERQIEQQDADLVALRKKLEGEIALSKLSAQSAWRDISEVTFDEGDRYLLANIIYCEAGGEPYEGQVAVGAVVINRVLSSVYPDTVVGVIYQSGQFSPVGSGRLALALSADKATASCYQAADEAMRGVTNVGNSVYFRTPIEGLEGIRIGGHVFY